MNDRDEAFVVAVSGMSGAGKSSVVRKTVERLGDATALHFDDYAAESIYPPDLHDWLARGADVDEWKTPRLVADLRKLRRGPYAYVLVEEPFGKTRTEMRELIDLAAHLELPADVLLARRLLRRIEEERHQYGDRLVEQLHRDLRDHLATDRTLELTGAANARSAADVVLDGRQTIEEIAETLAEEIRRASSRRPPR